MARQLNRIISDLVVKVRQLASQRDVAESRNRELEGKVEDLESKLQEAEHQIEILKMESDFLTLSHRLADSPEHLIDARRRVARMIAKIDRCVALLKEDADIS